MCRVRNREYPATPESVADARHWAQATLRSWEIEEETAADAALLTSELLTNAVVHARGHLELTLAVADGVLEVGVSDQDQRLPRRRTPGPIPAQPEDTEPAPAGLPWWLDGDSTREGGRGLLLVDELADEWGVATLAVGKQVWFRLRIGVQWPHLADCPCRGEELDPVRLASGRSVHAVSGPWDDDR